MNEKLTYLLLQVRNPDDPMRGHEVGCFARALRTEPARIHTFDLLTGTPTASELGRVDVVLLGGSGHYSAAGDGTWLEPILDCLREIHAKRKPTFASCWGFQAFARALGGKVVNDLGRAELGTHELRLTPAGGDDPVFGPLGGTFQGQMGHEDCVVELPAGATLLASTELVEHQAFRFDDCPIYCTQFHAELNREDLLARVRTYPEYVERVAGMTFERFDASCHDTPETEALLRRFIEWTFDE